MSKKHIEKNKSLAVLNPHKKEDLMEILMTVEHSVDSPVTKLKGSKHCPYCYATGTHNERCELNNNILLMMMHNFTRELKECVHSVLKKIEWKGSHIPVCPYCSAYLPEGHKDYCFYNRL